MTVEPFKERQRRAREEAILDAAAEMLRARGFQAMSMEEIAARVGIAKGTIYLHFASKDALAAALVARGIAALTTCIDGLDPDLPILERLDRILHAMLGGAVQHDHGAPFLDSAAPELKRLIETDERCAELVRGLRARLTALIDEGQRREEIDPRQPATVLVGALFALLSPRSYSQMLATADIPVPAVNDALIRLYMRGIAQDPAGIDRSQ